MNLNNFAVKSECECISCIESLRRHLKSVFAVHPVWLTDSQTWRRSLSSCLFVCQELKNLKTWHPAGNVNNVMLLSVLPRWPLCLWEIQISLNLLVSVEEFSSNCATTSKAPKWERQEGVWLWRGAWREGICCEGHSKDISPEPCGGWEGLYSFVCLSVPLRFFTGKRLRQAVCNNIPPFLFF